MYGRHSPYPQVEQKLTKRNRERPSRETVRDGRRMEYHFDGPSAFQAFLLNIMDGRYTEKLGKGCIWNRAFLIYINRQSLQTMSARESSKLTN